MPHQSFRSCMKLILMIEYNFYLYKMYFIYLYILLSSILPSLNFIEDCLTIYNLFIMKKKYYAKKVVQLLEFN